MFVLYQLEEERTVNSVNPRFRAQTSAYRWLPPVLYRADGPATGPWQGPVPQSTVLSGLP